MVRKVLVTGASRGIGKEIALEFGRRGMAVYGTAVSAEGFEKIQALLSEHSISGEAFQLDISDREQLTAFSKTLKERSIHPDILINNASIVADQLLIKLNSEKWDQVIHTNLDSVFYLSKVCIRNMIKNSWGRIINITSVVGLIGNAGQCNYAATKSGIIGFSKSLAREVATRNITVNCVAPGFIDTSMTRAMPEEAVQKITQNIPMQRLGSGQDVAKTVAFLASDDAAYITGETISVNGGLYMN